MRWQERDPLLRVDEMVRAGHRLIVDSVIHDNKDPVFGAEVEKHFEKLFDSIQQALDAGHV